MTSSKFSGFQGASELRALTELELHEAVDLFRQRAQNLRDDRPRESGRLSWSLRWDRRYQFTKSETILKWPHAY